ncbi:hypothetical protein COB21_02395 [Candidatus Aerophobetes bacterium]|uniref:tRNA/rRNA methyltransferase SpoU type domain-containing protein n=1 Tax=Aerophobetes bacterium TaxID=2030807 RepID=A0A2A4X6Z6_UNCAE|nr:MAG: hypothetical protein COB21_02395 [Candidatus Aerophobetes bacterium]
MSDLSVIKSGSHPLIKHLVQLRTCKKYRQTSNAVFIEGEKVIFDLASNHTFEKLIVVEGATLPPSIRFVEKHVISEQNFKKISGVNTNSTLAATLKKPEARTFKSDENLLIFDRIQDPGNMGMLVRSALAFGYSGVFLVEGSVDYFNDKTVRTSRGAVFSLPFQEGSLQELLLLASKNKARLLIADLEGKSPESITKDANPFYLVVGNEGQGVSAKIKNKGEAITLATHPHVESLNVAAAGSILLYLLQHLLQPENSIEV